MESDPDYPDYLDKYIQACRQANPGMPVNYDWRAKVESRIKPLGRMDGTTFAHSWENPSVSGIAINKKWGVDAVGWEKNLARQEAVQHFPVGCSTIKSIADHELGHQLDALLGLSVDNEVIAAYKAATQKGMRSEVSGYAATNIQEFIAECWGESCNNPQPRHYAAIIAGIVRRRYADKFAGVQL